MITITQREGGEGGGEAIVRLQSGSRPCTVSSLPTAVPRSAELPWLQPRLVDLDTTSGGEIHLHRYCAISLDSWSSVKKSPPL